MTNMKKTSRLLILAAVWVTGLLIPALAGAEDYQYQYFSEEQKYVPFSDYIPKVRRHYQTVPHYVEDFYQLYGMKQYYNENSLRKNIARLETALTCKFRHPSQALVKVESEEEYLKYRNLMFMHINMLIMRNHLKIATRYDKQKVRFHDLDFAKEIKESLDIAEGLYRKAIPYWFEARKYAQKASEIKITTDLGYIESERHAIMRGSTDFEKIIGDHLRRLEKKKETVSAAAGREDK